MANKNAGKNGIATRFSGKERQRASDAAKKSGVVRGNHAVALFREACKEVVTYERMLKMVEAIAEKAELGDYRSFEILRDTMGEKPKEQIEQTINEIAFRVEGVSQEEADEIFG